ncbi:hypothetical protein K491DRAFT_70284 [Lophiostoma macrostomum CBS 122681]|uniref:Uncharacterized protein n=1 Tax=Lophiostoma macrostomum CBS 122681 TaxID=1314788 RepID=A0A6A6SWV6_9PLEO|nr:hypothetical protein K491DRAFT_70284 [Lophiostoma macrostomum CBS 122681]
MPFRWILQDLESVVSARDPPVQSRFVDSFHNDENETESEPDRLDPRIKAAILANHEKHGRQALETIGPLGCGDVAKPFPRRCMFMAASLEFITTTARTRRRGSCPRHSCWRFGKTRKTSSVYIVVCVLVPFLRGHRCNGQWGEVNRCHLPKHRDQWVDHAVEMKFSADNQRPAPTSLSTAREATPSPSTLSTNKADY